MTTLLALDTATEACSVALLHNGEITHLDEFAQRTHTKRILPMIDEILTQSGIKLTQVDALAFGRGPGSFTGVRVGAGIAQGLALGADLPVIPISNLTTMAQQANEQYGAKHVLCAIDARMNEVYFSQLNAQTIEFNSQSFIQWNEIVEERVCSPEDVLKLAQKEQNTCLKVGTGWEAYSQLAQITWAAPSDILLPSAQAMLSLALPCYLQKQWISAVEIEPVYLRNEVTWKKLPGRE